MQEPAHARRIGETRRISPTLEDYLLARQRRLERLTMSANLRAFVRQMFSDQATAFARPPRPLWLCADQHATKPLLPDGFPARLLV